MHAADPDHLRLCGIVQRRAIPRASIALGKKQTAEAEQILGNCFVTQLLVSAALARTHLETGRCYWHLAPAPTPLITVWQNIVFALKLKNIGQYRL